MFNVPNKSKLQHPWNLTFAMVVVREGWGGRTVMFQMLLVLGAQPGFHIVESVVSVVSVVRKKFIGQI